MAIRLWSRWKKFAHRAAEIQSKVVLTILYWVAVVPVGLLRRRPTSAAAWHTRPAQGDTSVESARRQF